MQLNSLNEPPGARALGGPLPGGFFTFSCIFAGLGLCFQLRPSFFQGFVLLFLSVYYRRPAGVGRDPEIFFFAYKAHHPIVGPFRSCSVLVRQIRARENFLQKMDLFFVFSKIRSEIKIEKKSCLLIS